MPDIEHWTDVSIPEPPSVLDPFVRMGVELGLESRLMPWVDGRPAATNFERWFERPRTRITETP